MTTHTDRAALEKAIGEVMKSGSKEMSGGVSWISIPSVVFDVIAKAAQAHLGTLPRTKMVEHYRVEGWDPLSGPWVACYPDKEMAEITADAYRKAAAHSCIKVTGPHVQEVTST